MAQELQHLIDRIQKEGVDKAEQEAEEIVSKAKTKAASIVREAEDQAKALLAKADEDAKAFTERSTKALQQASRDLLISVGTGVENIVSDLVEDALDDAMDATVIQDMLVKIAEAYSAQKGEESRVEYLISPEDQTKVVEFFADRYRQKLAHGIEVHVDSGIFKGFKVAFVDEHVQHDFTKEAIAEALSNFLRPHLAEIVHRAARNGSSGGEA